MKLFNVLAIATIAVLTAGPAFAQAVPVPEPGTLALLAGGVAATLLIRRRKK
jgi:hypothetical protein